jgi:hypothetical protein
MQWYALAEAILIAISFFLREQEVTHAKTHPSSINKMDQIPKQNQQENSSPGQHYYIISHRKHLFIYFVKRK